MSQKLKAESLLEYYERTRGVGHTKATINGAGSSKSKACLLLAVDHKHAKFLRPKVTKGALVYVMHDLSVAADRRQPILLDNFTIITVLEEAVAEVKRLRLSEFQLSSKLKRIAEIAS